MSEPACPRLSVIIPAYNAAPFLAEAVASVRAQTLDLRPEIVIFDDGSSDQTWSVISSLEGVIARRGAAGPRGCAYARNRAIEASSGSILAFLDADDLWLPDKLALQMPLLEANSENFAVFGQVQEFDEHGPRGEFQRAALPLTCLLPREVALRVGPFEETLKLGDFADWLARLQDLPGRLLYVEHPLALRRLHAGNLGRREAHHSRDYLEVVRRRLARRRSVS